MFKRLTINVEDNFLNIKVNNKAEEIKLKSIDTATVSSNKLIVKSIEIK
jgi:hypothetical protein